MDRCEWIWYIKAKTVNGSPFFVHFFINGSPVNYVILFLLRSSSISNICSKQQFCDCYQEVFHKSNTHTHPATQIYTKKCREPRHNYATRHQAFIVQDLPECFIYRTFNARNQIDLTNLTLLLNHISIILGRLKQKTSKQWGSTNLLLHTKLNFSHF